MVKFYIKISRYFLTATYLPLVSRRGSFALQRILIMILGVVLLLSTSLKAQFDGIKPSAKIEKNTVKGQEFLYPFLNRSECGLNYIAKSAKLTNRSSPVTAIDPTISISGVSSANGVEVLAAYLYWVVEGGSGAGNNFLTFKSPTGSRTIFGTEIGVQNKGKCWGCKSATHFRANVLSHICPTDPNGKYTFSDYPSSFYKCPTPGGCICKDGDTDGLTLIIIYKDYSATYNGTFILHDGIQYSQGGDLLINKYENLKICNAPKKASLFTVISDYQLNGNWADKDWILVGATRKKIRPNFYNQEDISFNLSQNTTTLTTNVSVLQDCYTVILQGLYYQNENCQNKTCKPNPNPILPTAGKINSYQICKNSVPPPLKIYDYTGEVLKWQQSIDCEKGPWIDIEKFEPILELQSLSSTTCFRALINNNGCRMFTIPAVITVSNEISGGKIDGIISNCGDNKPQTLTLKDYAGDVVYWESSKSKDCDIGGGNWSKIQHPFPTLQVQNLTTNTCFRATVHQGNCPDATSEIAIVTFISSPVGGNITGTETVCKDDPSAKIILKEYTGRILYWESSEDCDFSGEWTRINNYSDSLITSVYETTCFRAVLKITNCPIEQSPHHKVIVQQNTDTGELSGSVTLCGVNNATKLQLSGYSGEIIRWESSSDNWNTLDTINTISGENSLFIQNLTKTTQFRAVVKAGNCSSKNSNTVTITIVDEPVPGKLTTEQTVCLGEKIEKLNFLNLGGSIVRWEYSVNNVDWIEIPGTKDQISFLPNISRSTSFRVVLGSNSCPEIYSEKVEIKVLDATKTGILTQSMTICGSLPEAVLKLSDYGGTILNWESSLDLIHWNVISKTDSEFIINDLNTTTHYRVKVQNAHCSTVYSNVVSLVISEEPIGGNLPKDTVFCSGNSGTHIQLSNYKGRILAWEKSNNLLNWVRIPQSAIDHIDVPKIIQPTYYRVLVDNPGCDFVYSDTLEIFPTEPTIPGILSKDISKCAKFIEHQAILTDYVGKVIFWESRTRDGNNWGQWSRIESEKDKLKRTYEITTQIRAVVQNEKCAEERSNLITIEILPPTVPGNILQDDSLCMGETSNKLELKNYIGEILRWEISKNQGNTWTSIGKRGYDWYKPGKLTVTTWFRAIVKNGSCEELPSNPVKIAIFANTIGGQLIAPVNVCEDEKVNLQLLQHKGQILFWEKSTDDGLSWVKINHKEPTYTGLINITTSFRVYIKNGSCNGAYSAVAKIFLLKKANGGILERDRYVCRGSSGGILTLKNYVGDNIKWEYSGDQNFWRPISNTLNTYQTEPIFETTYYRVLVKQGRCGIQYSNTVKISLVDELMGGKIIGDSVFCSDEGSAILKVVDNMGLVMRWEYSLDNGFTFSTLNHYSEELLITNLSVPTIYRAISGGGTCPEVISKEWLIKPSISPKITYRAILGCGNLGTIYPMATSGSGVYSFYLKTSDKIIYPNAKNNFENVAVNQTYMLCVRDKNGCEAMVNVTFPSQLATPEIYDLSYTNQSQILVKWDLIPGINVRYILFYRINGEESWNYESSQSVGYRLVDQLQHSTEYEFKVLAFCDGDSIFSIDTKFQKTKSYGGCLLKNPPFPGGIYINSITPTTATLFWTEVENLNSDAGYIISYGLANLNPNTWTQYVVCKPATQFDLININPNFRYAVRIRTNCSNCTTALKHTDKRSNWSPIYYFNTNSIRETNFNDCLEETLQLHVIIPNPNNGKFQISNPENISHFIVYDLLGRKITDMIQLKAGIEIDLSYLDAGLYSIQIFPSPGNKNFFLRWIKY